MALLCSVGVVHAQMLPNGDMEQWDTLIHYWEPVGWNTSALTTGFLPFSDLPIEMAQGQNPGDTAIRLRTVILPFLGLQAGIMGNYNLIYSFGKVPYQSKPDTLTAIMQYKLNNGDTFTIVALFYDQNNSANLIGGGLRKFTGQTNGWMEAKVPISYFSANNPGYVQIAAFFEGDPLQPDNVVEIDSLGFNVPEQLENNSFEKWEEIITVDPVGWFSQNWNTQWTGSPPHVVPDTDAVSGQLSARIQTLVNPHTGSFGWGLQTRGDNLSDGFIPLSNAPSSLKFFYKYSTDVDTPNTGLCIVVLHSNVPATIEAQKDTIVVPLLPTNDAWKQLQIDLTQTALPSVDSIFVNFMATNDLNKFDTSNVLKIDALEMEFITGTDAQQPIEVSYLVQPVVADDYIQIHSNLPQTESVRIDIRDVQGRSIYSRSNYQWGTSVDVSSLRPGTYHIFVIRDHTWYPLRFVKQ